MNDKVFNDILAYISCETRPSFRVYIPDKILYKNVAKKFILQKFLAKWLDNPLDDPINIIDNMLLNYYMWESTARENNNNELIELYGVYVKTLIKLKSYIIKEEKR